MKRTAISVLAMLMVTWIPAGQADQNKLYRYKDEKGQLVIRSTISAERTALGYDILDGKGRLIETVPPLVTSLSDKLEADRLKKEQEAFDLSLIRRYSFVKDIEVEKKRKITESSVRLSVLKGNLNGIRSELEAAYSEAAESERKGEELNPDLKKRIGQLENKITITEDQLQQRESEIKLLEEQYDRAIERFKEIDVLRNRASPPADNN